MTKRTHLFFLLLLLITGCRKEKSLEGGDPNPIWIGTNCRVSQVLTVDSVTSFGFEAHNAFFDSKGLATGTELYDSLTNSTIFRTNYFYKGDTAYVNNGQYFVLDKTTGRVKEFKGLEDPTDPLSDTITIKFTYNGAGQLTAKDYYFFNLPTPALHSTYTYTNGNLTKMLFVSLFPTSEIIADATLEYNTNQPVKNFMYIFPDGYLITPYILSFNFGTRPANSIKKINTRFYSSGAVTDSLVTNYKNYVLSRDNYVLDVYAEGDYQDGVGNIFERTKFQYKCQ